MIVSAVDFHFWLNKKQSSAAQLRDSKGYYQRRGERWLTTHKREGATSHFFTLLGADKWSFCKFTGDTTVKTFSSEKIKSAAKSGNFIHSSRDCCRRALQSMSVSTVSSCACCFLKHLSCRSFRCYLYSSLCWETP